MQAPLDRATTMARRLLLSLACLVHVAMAQQPLFPDLHVGGELTDAPAGVNYVVAMASDDSHVYAATLRHVVKMKANDLTERTVVDLTGDGVSEITALAVDGGDLVLTVKKGDAYEVQRRATGSLDTIECSSAIDSSEFTPFAIAVDDAHIYTGHRTFPGKVARWKRQDCAPDGKLTLAENEDDVRSFAYDAQHDARHLYAGTNSQPGRVVKIALGTFERVGSVLYHRQSVAVASRRPRERRPVVVLGTSPLGVLG